MSEVQALEKRGARLKLEHGASGVVLKAQVPTRMSEAEFVRVATNAYGLIHNLTNCNCMSGRISFVVEDIYNEVINVAFE
jgi:hypothetical protein